MSEQMSDQGWNALGDKVEPTWGPEREWAVRAAITRRVARRRVARRTTGALACAGVLVAGALTVVKWRPAVPGSAPSLVRSDTDPAPSGQATVRSAGDSAESVTVTELSPDTVLAPLSGHGGRGFALHAGGARFSVPHDSHRPFVVTARDIAIEDLGTIFTVRFIGTERLMIAVEEGRVRVRGSGTDTEVPAGATLEVPVAALPEPAAKQQRRTNGGASSWRRFAERGQYEEAQKALRTAGPNAVRDDTADLLLAADAARLSGHPAESVTYLERVVRGHARDPRAGLAAFTLGRVLLDELGRPREAVEAFARARSSGGPLAEDALARQVEAASRAGDVSLARELALRYQRLYPHGHRAKAVSRFGGLD